MLPIELGRANLGNDLRLQYAERGRGPAIIFVHGYSDSWYSFESIMRRLPDDVRALAPTQRGHGDSDRPKSGYGIEDFGADVVRFMDAVGVASAALVGHSMGSLVAQEVAAAHPDRVSRLVLVGSATTVDNPVARELDAAVRELRDPIPRQFVADFQASTGYRPIPDDVLATAVSESLKMPARVWRDAMAGILSYRAGSRLSALTMPTLIVWGDRDEICPRVEQDRLRQGISGSTLAIYEETGHAPHWEQPQRFVDDLVAFLAPLTISASSPPGARTPR
jgi:pimeloyl-ACP methyl ester carboxylesterase